MAGKTTDWRPGPTVCRCCLTEGCYKDISTEYFWMGKREVYAEMLSDTFNVSISYSQSGPNSASRLICEPCISRLRDASDFKRQVQDCEKTFMTHLDPSASKPGSVQIEVESLDDVKMERVKVEKDESDDDDFAAPDFGDDDDDDDDLDNEPLTKLASKVPKKESVDLLDMLDTSQITVKRKSSSKTKEPPKKVKKKEVVVKPTTSKAKAKATAAAEKKKKEQIPMVIARRNAYMLVEHTTAYPFRNPESSIMCVYCCESFPEASTFRLHMQDNHRTFKTKNAFHHINEAYLKVDVTDLKCRICDETFCRIEDAAVHLSGEHYKEFDFTCDLGVYPFHMDSKLLCGVCDFRAPNLRNLSRHIQKHYLQFMCEHCGKEFCTNTSLIHHVRTSCSKLSDNQKRCKKCRKVVVTSMEEHFKESETCKQHICNTCGERLATWKLKQKHLEEEHSISRKKYPCPECILVFENSNRLRNHFITTHTDNFFACPHCGLRFDTRHTFNRHLIIHTGEKSFVCDVCSKAFNRRSTLNQHMWIHSTVKKWVCKLCQKPFNQKVCWKSHMKSNHPEAYNENA